MPPATLHTPRLWLRQLRAGDLGRLAALADTRRVSGELLNVPHPFGPAEAKARLAQVTQQWSGPDARTFAVALLPGGDFIGEVGVHRLPRQPDVAQLAYWIGVPYWGHGYGAEAAAAAVAFAREHLRVNAVVAETRVRNLPSRALLERLGFSCVQETGRLRHYRLTLTTYT